MEQAGGLMTYTVGCYMKANICENQPPTFRTGSRNQFFAPPKKFILA